MSIEICTIGFSQKPLKKFISHLKMANVKKLIDTRLNNTSQLSGFAKKDDLSYIMELVGIEYIHDVSLAPTSDILDDFKKKRITWDDYEKKYLDLLYKRKVENRIDDIVGEETPCFLCSEHKPHHCHRRLLAEYLKEFNKDIKINHLF